MNRIILSLTLLVALTACGREPLHYVGATTAQTSVDTGTQTQTQVTAPTVTAVGTRTDATTDTRPDAGTVQPDALVAALDARIIIADAQVIPDLSPQKNDASAVDTAVIKTDVSKTDGIIAVVTPDAAKPDALVAKTDTGVADTIAAKTDAQVPADAFLVKADAIAPVDTLPSPDLAPTKTDTQASGLVVAYSAVNPAGYTAYNGTEKVGLLRVELSGNGKVSSVAFKHHGSPSSDWGNFYLFDGDTLLMSASADPVTNEIVFSRLLLTLTNRTAQLYLTGDLNTTAVSGNTHHFSLESADKVTANVPVSGTFPVVGNTFTATGILPLDIEPSADLPVSSMIVGANTTDNSVFRMDMNGATEPVSIQCATFFATGTQPGVDIVSLRVFDKAGSMICSGALDTNNQLTCINNNGLFMIDGTATVTLKVNVDQVGFSGTPYPVASGDQFQVGIMAQQGVSGRAGCFRGIGSKTGLPYTQRDLATGAATSWSIKGPPMTVRKTQPYVATIQQSQSLINGENSLYKFSVTASLNADVSIKRFLVTSHVVDVGSIGNARLKVNDTAFDAVSIGVPGGTWGVDLKTGAITNPNGAVGIVFTADNEIVVAAGTSRTFTFLAIVTGIRSGSSIVSNIAADPFDSTMGPISSHESNHFLWSDNSADTHSLTSADWIGGALVKTFPTNAQYIGQ